MASIVTITAPSELVQCDQERRAQQVFNVSNSTGRAIRVGVKVLVDDRAQESWFTIAGPAERDLAEKVTAQVSVGVQVPPDTPLGNYPFRLLVFSTATPGEDYTESPTVAIEVQPPTDEGRQQAERKKMPLRIPVAALAVLLLGGLAWAVWPTGVKVPDLVGKDLKQAEQLLSQSSLKGEIAGLQPTADQDPRTIWHQDPEAGQGVADASAVRLIVVTNCLAPYRAATEGGGCEWSCAEGTTPDSNINQCVCKARHTESGKDHLGRRTCINMGNVVTTGGGAQRNPRPPPAAVEVPDVVSKSLRDAEQLLRMKNLKSEVMMMQLAGEHAPDTIWHQDPGAGQRITHGSVVRLILATELKTSVCPGPYRGITQGGYCGWLCAEGTTPDSRTNRCVCKPGYVEAGKDQSGRRICRARS